MPRTVTIHDMDLTHSANPAEPVTIEITLEDGATVKDARQAVADMARGGRIDEVKYFILAGRKLKDEDPFPADTTYAAVKFASSNASSNATNNATSNASSNATSNATEGGRRRRRGSRKSRKATRKHGGARKASRKGRKASRKARKSRKASRKSHKGSRKH